MRKLLEETGQDAFEVFFEPVADRIAEADAAHRRELALLQEQNRHELERADRVQRRRTEVQTLWITGGLVAGMLAAGLLAAFEITDLEIQKATYAFLAPVLTAWLGYAAGRVSGKSGG